MARLLGLHRHGDFLPFFAVAPASLARRAPPAIILQRPRLGVVGRACVTARALARLVAMLLWGCSFAHAANVAEVQFPSADGRTMLRGFVFEPTTPPPWPAVVMLHGRSGPYSTAAGGRYDAFTLSLRHKQWGSFWAERGYLALHVDSFGPRGYPQGFPIGSYGSRPPEVNEQSVRPLDAYGGAAYLRSRPDVVATRIGLQGWSNGAMTVLATMQAKPPGLNDPSPLTGFRAALLFYPSCRIQLEQDYRPYAPALMFIAADDEEVAPLPCSELVDRVRARGIDHFEMVWYAGASHAFDDPGRRRQSLEPNRAARADALIRAETFFKRYLRD